MSTHTSNHEAERPVATSPRCAAYGVDVAFLGLNERGQLSLPQRELLLT